MKKIAILLLVLSLLVGSVACKENSKGSGKAEIWSAPDTEKVLQDKEYEGEKGEAKIFVASVRNEYEGAQLILTAESDVSAYTVKTASLSKANGKVYDVKNVSVYNQKYIAVTRTTTNSFPAGMYPDAILPFDAAVEYGENKIEAGQNQGLFFSFYVPEDQEAGIYSGSFTVTVDGVNKEIPVSLQVYDYTLSDKVHSRSSFGVHRYWNEGGIISAEKDASYDMYAAYYEYLLEHRVSTRYLPAANDDIEGFVKQLKKYVQNEKCSNYIIPYAEAYDASFAGTGINYELYETTLNAIAEASIEDNYNYLLKASTYFAMFDEITASADIQKANSFYKKIYELHGKIAEKWETALDCEAEFKEELIDTLLSINMLMVTTFDTRFNVGLTWCPLLDKYSTQSSKDLYGETYEIESNGYTITQNAEKWWYSAGIPKNPYPSYHIDDNGYSPIVYSWMQYANGVTGNLYWSATFYLERVSENGKWVYNALQDCYDTAMRFPSTNGDGFLMYPGAPYGIYGPVGSLRLEQLRDGLEEYDLLYALEEYYDQYSGFGDDVDFDSVLQLLYDNLFNGMRVETDHDRYEEMRQTLLSMLEMADKSGVIVLKTSNVENTASMKIFVPEGKTAEFSGEQAEEVAVAGGKIITVNQTLSGKNNIFEISADGYKFELDLGGERVIFANEKLQSALTAKEGDTLTLEEYSGVEVSALTLAARESGLQEVYFNSSLYSLFGKETERLTIRMYSDCDCVITLYFTGKNDIALPISTVEISQGYNEIEVVVSVLNWTTLGSLKDMYIRVEDSNDNVQRIFRFAEIEVM